MRGKLTRPGIHPVISGLAVIVVALVAVVPTASAYQGQLGAPGHLPGHSTHHGHSGAPGHLPGHHAARHHRHHDRPGHGGHAGAPGR